MKFPLSILIFSFCILASCCHKEEEVPIAKEPAFSVSSGWSLVRESLFRELDTSVWILRSYTIKKGNEPGKRYIINASDEYKFFPHLNAVIKNELRIGKIKWEDAHIPADMKDVHGNPYGKGYNFHLSIDQSHEWLVNGDFRIVYGRLKRLHLEQVRLNNETKEKEYRRLIFYKK